MLIAYVWDYVNSMRFLRIFREAAVDLDSCAAALEEQHRFLLCCPDAFVDLLGREDFDLVEPRALETATPFLVATASAA
jgi:hypothetical protein